MPDGRVLLVEGKDDEKVVRHLCTAHGIPVTFEIHQPEGPQEYGQAGVDRLLDQVPTRLKSGTDRLAVVLDADENAETRWIQLRDRLRENGFQGIPNRPSVAGTVVDLDLQTRTARLGVWIMPNNSLPGMLEDFLAWLVPANDKTLPHVDRFLNGIPAADQLFTDQHKPKARIHSYLAVQEDPGKPLGLAITCKFLDANKTEVVAPFLAWLRAVLLDDLPADNG